MSKVRITQDQGSQIRIKPLGGLQVSANGPSPEVKLSVARGEIGPRGPSGALGNSVFITQNTDGASLTTNGINFVNTSSISVSVANSPNGYANISFTAIGDGSYNQANSAYAQANVARNTANAAYAQANIAYGSANTVTVSQNGGSTLSNKQLNFVNTSSVLAIVTDSGNGNANVSFITSFASPGDAYAQANAAYNAANLKLDIAGGTITGSLNVNNNLYVKGDISLDGNLVIGNANTDTINIVADFTSNLNPDVSNTFSLGTNAKQWKDIYVATANVNTINLTGDIVASETSNVKVGGTTTLNTSYISANVVISGPTETTYNVFTTNADTPIVIDSFPSPKFTTVKYIIQSKSIDGYHATELFCMQDGIEAYLTEYATLINNYTLGSYSLTVSGGVCNLYFNPNNPSRNIITVKLVRTALTT